MRQAPARARPARSPLAPAFLGPKELRDTHGPGVTSVARLGAIAELARRFSEDEAGTAEMLSGAEERPDGRMAPFMGRGLRGV